MKKLQFSFILFMFFVFPMAILASEAKIVVVGAGEGYCEDASTSSVLTSYKDENTCTNNGGVWRVGETGDCTLIESNGEYLLVDTCIGDNTTEKFAVLDFMKKYFEGKEIKSIGILISHYHGDHLGALVQPYGIFGSSAKTNYPFISKINKIYLPDHRYLDNYYDENGPWYTTNFHDKIVEYAGNNNIEIVHLWSDTSNGNQTGFSFGDVDVDVIGPVEITCTSNCGHEYDAAAGTNGSRYGHYINDHSLVTMFRIGNIKYLSAGDIESSTELNEIVANGNFSNFQEEKLVNSKCDMLSADILKLNHHGLRTSNSRSFLSCVKPKFVFYSSDNEAHNTMVLPQVNQIVNDWKYRFNLFSTVHSTLNGNGSFVFNIKDNTITVDKISFSDNDYERFNTVNVKDININYADSDSGSILTTSTATFSTSRGKYYYLNDYIKPVAGHIYDFQANDSLTTGGNLTDNINVDVFFKATAYGIDNTRKLIKGINSHSTGANIISNVDFTSESNPSFYRDGNVIARTDMLKTGDNLRYYLNKKDNMYTIIVKGDIDGDGYLTYNGARTVARQVIDGNVLSDNNKLLAADFNSDGNIKMNDVIRMLNDVKVGWVKKQNNTYYYDNSGVMSIGWKTIEYGGENSKFYFDSNGKMATSWNVIDGHLYYFSPETGAMIKQLAGYTFDENGYLVASSGWHELGDGKYYSNSNDTYLTGWQKIGDDWYYFDEFGKIKTGWQLLTYNNDQYWYYFNETGVMQTGWQKIDNKWYYLFAGGSMAKGWQKIDDDWYYFKPYGTMVTDWQKIDYNWYYFNPGGSMVRDTCKTIESSNFCFNSFGVCTSGSGC